MRWRQRLAHRPIARAPGRNRRSGSDRRRSAAVISRPPSLPIARMTAVPPETRPCSSLHLGSTSRQQRGDQPFGEHRVSDAGGPRRWLRSGFARRPGMPARRPMIRAWSSISSSDRRRLEQCGGKCLVGRSSPHPAIRCQAAADRVRHRECAGGERMAASRGADPMMSANSRISPGLRFQQREKLDAGRQAGQETGRSSQ